jgi:hypothetical protein
VALRQADTHAHPRDQPRAHRVVVEDRRVVADAVFARQEVVPHVDRGGVGKRQLHERHVVDRALVGLELLIHRLGGAQLTRGDVIFERRGRVRRGRAAGPQDARRIVDRRDEARRVSTRPAIASAGVARGLNRRGARAARDPARDRR